MPQLAIPLPGTRQPKPKRAPAVGLTDDPLPSDPEAEALLVLGLMWAIGGHPTFDEDGNLTFPNVAEADPDSLAGRFNARLTGSGDLAAAAPLVVRQLARDPIQDADSDLWQPLLGISWYLGPFDGDGVHGTLRGLRGMGVILYRRDDGSFAMKPAPHTDKATLISWMGEHVDTIRRLLREMAA